MSIIFLFGFAFGYFCAQFILKRRMVKNIVENPEGLIRMITEVNKNYNEAMEELEPTEIIIEEHKDSFFVYNKKTNQFLGQGRSHEAALSVVKERFPFMDFKIANEPR
jgi:Holliday junction resolvasome RuvABC endonuclease subunit